MEILMLKAPNGALVPANEEEAEKLKRIKPMAMTRVGVAVVRNGPFLRKWMALAHVAYDMWTETMEPIEYRGQKVQPVFEKFRKDLTILAGYWHPVFKIDGTFTVEADSISYANMDQETFEALYSKTIDAILAKVLPRHGLSRQALDHHVDRVLEFA